MSEPRVVTDRGAVAATAADAPPGARVPVEVRLSVADPFRAYRRARTGRGGAFLETTGGQAGWGYAALAPSRWVSVDPDGSALERLRALLAGEHLARGDCEVPYPCAAVGWLSYDVAREVESLPDDTRDDRGLPRLQLGVYGTLAAWREPRDDGAVELRVTACPRVGGDRPGGGAWGVGTPSTAEPLWAPDPEAAFEVGRERALAVAGRLKSGDPGVAAPSVDPGPVESTAGRAGFAERVRTVQERIRAGETFQVNVSHRLSTPAAVHPVEAYAALRERNPAPYSGLLEFPGVDLVGASPELLLEREGDRLTTEPIAATRPRGRDAGADADLEADLRGDEKERAEHAMLVDLERNDVGKVAAYGSVAVEEYRRVDRYSEVMHLVSRVTGRLRDGVDTADCVAALFPGGTVTGAPKPRTMAIVDAVEATRRGPYTGSVGLFGFDDRATLNIVIRTLVGHDDRYHLRVGAGIVHDSDPEREYAETMAKARALLGALDDAMGERGLEVRA